MLHEYPWLLTSMRAGQYPPSVFPHPHDQLGCPLQISLKWKGWCRRGHSASLRLVLPIGRKIIPTFSPGSHTGTSLSGPYYRSTCLTSCCCAGRSRQEIHVSSSPTSLTKQVRAPGLRALVQTGDYGGSGVDLQYDRSRSWAIAFTSIENKLFHFLRDGRQQGDRQQLQALRFFLLFSSFSSPRAPRRAGARRWPTAPTPSPAFSGRTRG